MITEFSFWSPEGVDKAKLKAIIVLTPPSQSDGRGWIHDRDWQRFATTHACGLVGCHFVDDDPSGFEGYCDVKNCESGEKLIEYIQNQLYLHTAQIPKFLLFGFSAGGQFNAEFACAYPDNVKGFVVNKGGVYYTALAPEATRKIPSLWILGEKDADFRKDIIRAICNLNSHAGAREWKLITDYGVGHEMGVSVEKSMEFFAGILSTL